MKLSAYFNPFNLIRWTFFGKRLDEIIDFDEKRNELDAFFTRTAGREAKKLARIARLEAQNVIHAAQKEKAKLLSDNLLVMMTQALGSQPATVEPTDGEAA